VLRLSIFGTFRVADASGKEIPVKSRKSRALLAYLALPPGKPRSREQIMALLWSDRGDQQARSSLRQALSGLRRELGEERLSALRITDEALTLDPEQVLVEPASPGDVLLDGLHLNDPAFDEWLRDERLRHEGGSEPDPLPPGLSLPDKPSIAVLPFTNMSGDPEQEYFSDGITEDIITELSRFRSLFVIARNSSFTFKGQAVDLSEVAKRLGVRYILEGSVRRAANRVRITAQLIEAANQNHLWSERYDGQLEDIFSLQDDISERVVWALVGHLEQAETIKAKRSGTVDPTAYDVMLRAFDQLVRYTPDDTAEAIRLMESVVATTPKSGMALSRLAAAYQLKYWWTGDLEWTRRAEEAANAALELGDNEESTEALLAYCAAIRGDFARAERHMERALANNPHNRHTMYYHMSIQNIRGHPEAALEVAKRLRRLDPINPTYIDEEEGYAFYLAGRYEESIVAFERSMPNHFHEAHACLAAAYGQVGDKQSAQRAWGRCVALRPGYTLKSFADEAVYEKQDDMEHWLDGLRKEVKQTKSGPQRTSLQRISA
jgi:TolB-like protein/Flp pilus assembly protein TadD